MLQIFIHGDKQSGFLDLTPGTKLDIEALQEPFDEDLTTGEFSLPIDIPWTDNNRRLLVFAERIENFNKTPNFFVCTVYQNMFPELVRAKFIILGKSGSFNYRKGKFSASISGGKGLFSSNIKGKKLTDLALGGQISWGAGNGNSWYASLYSGNFNPGEHITANNGAKGILFGNFSSNQFISISGNWLTAQYITGDDTGAVAFIAYATAAFGYSYRDIAGITIIINDLDSSSVIASFVGTSDPFSNQVRDALFGAGSDIVALAESAGNILWYTTTVPPGADRQISIYNYVPGQTIGISIPLNVSNSVSLGTGGGGAQMASREWAYNQTKGMYPGRNYLMFAPVAIEGFFDTERKDYAGEFLARDTVNTVVLTGPDVEDWVFGRPSANNPAIALTPGEEGYGDYRTVPFFKTQYVLKKCFEENGFTVTGDFINELAFKSLVVFNNYGIEKMNLLETDINNMIIPKNHVPDVFIGDWLRALFSVISLFPIFADDNQVQLVYHKTHISVKRITTLEDVVTGDFESNFADGQNDETGFKVGYAWDPADQYISERVKDLSDKNLCATVATFSELATLNIGRSFDTDDIVLVTGENLYYVVADATSSPILFDCYAENLGEFVEGDGSKSVEITMSTLCQYVEKNEEWEGAVFIRQPYLGCKQQGSYINKMGALVKKEFGNKVFFIGTKFLGAVLAPFSFNHNKDVNDAYLCQYSLSIKGKEGLAEQFHLPWLKVLENAELVTVQAKYSEKLLARLRNYNRFQIAGTLFLLKKIEKSIPPGPTIKLELVAL